LVGSIFFFSTIGSIVGSIAAGFFLIPHLGLTNTITMVSVGLILWAIIALLSLRALEQSNPNEKLPLPLPVIITLAIGIAVYFSFITFTVAQTDENIRTLYRQDAFYSQLHVFEWDKNGQTFRFLKNDVNNSSAIIPGSPTPVFTYTQLADIFTANNNDAQNYLVLGGGSYTIPRFIHSQFPNMQIDVVEIEPGLFPLAHQYFELPITEKITNHEQDARVFLQSTSTQYDVIFSDVMNSGLFIPPHLATVEFFEAFKARLAPNGIAIVNFIGSLDTSTMGLTGSMLKTIATVFPNYELLALRGPDHTGTQNIVIPDTEIIDYFNETQKIASTLTVNQASLSLDNQALFTDNKSNIEPLIMKQFGRF
jgi:spermidine synthase